jgi:cytochrome b6-f complex iron-sulfur subunit
MTDPAETPVLVNRREFLNLAWLASLGFFLIPIGGVTLLFAYPRFKEGEFGGQFVLGKVGEVFPQPDGDPGSNTKGKFWLTRLEDGSILALYKVCPHLGCLYNWQSVEHKFLCPCHGSQYELDGTYILGPAPRSLDRFVVRVLDESENAVAMTDEEGNAVPLLDENWQVVVETGDLIRGKDREEKYPTSEENKA